jgi:hypothetical protein
MKKFRGIWVAALVLLAALAGGCMRRPLEEAYRTSIRVIVKCIWQATIYPDGIKPSGVTLYFFKDGQFFTSLTTANVDSCEVQLPKGRYQMYMISQSPEEFWKMEFENMTDFDAADATLRSTARPNWLRSTDDVVVENPEILYAGVSDEFEITDEMTEDYQYHYQILKSLKSKVAKGATKADTKAEEEIAYYEERVQYYTIRIPIVPQNIVSQLWVTIYSGNADVLKSVRASTSGMAKTFELTQFTTNEDKAIQIISDWRLTMDDEENRVGHIDGIINSFGLPNGEQPTEMRDSTLNVSALLIDNSTVENYKFNVGDKIQMLPSNAGYRNLYRLVFGTVEEPAIKPPDVVPADSKTSGMDATVDDWEDGETVEIPM